MTAKPSSPSPSAPGFLRGRTHAFRVALFGLVAAAFAAPTAASAQERVLRGTVLDETTEVPVEGAAITLYSEEGEQVGEPTLSDRSGRFTLRAPAPGVYRIEVSRLGFQVSGTSRFEVPAEGPVQLRILLEARPIQLEGIDALARRRERISHSLVEEFYWRAENSVGGRFITREQLRNYPGMRLADVVTSLGGVSRTTIRGSQDLLMMRTAATMPNLAEIVLGANDGAASGDEGSTVAPGSLEAFFNDMDEFERKNICPIVFYLNGHPLNSLNNASYASVEVAYNLRADEIEGIEVYRGPAEVPGIYAGVDAACGVISIWTRRHATEIENTNPNPWDGLINRLFGGDDKGGGSGSG